MRDASVVPTLGPGHELPKAEPSARHGTIHPQENRAITFAALEANSETLERFNSLNVPHVMEMLPSTLSRGLENRRCIFESGCCEDALKRVSLGVQVQEKGRERTCLE